ncbi:hypothetical protein [uncultured Megasphaera sp.]|uniref:hypothetical protein n=1 Tax=uncultured Megasphaera sp. TaxID=165188 RepID=UPI00206EC4EA|nr:hypothetical protein [uncultured Megasphaera sp.]DAQ39062.1 MAG TPA: hypothetical protein [Caudoviricetes sp.]
MIKLTFEGTAQEVHDEMRAFVGAANSAMTDLVQAVKTEAKTKTEAVPVVPAAPTETATPTPAVPTAPVKDYTLDELLAAAGPLLDAGKGPELQALMQKYGVPSMMALPKEKFGELATDLRALGARI